MKRKYSISDISELLNVDTAIVLRWIKDRKIRSKKDSCRVIHRDLIKFMEFHRIPAYFLDEEYKNNKRILIADRDPELLDLIERALCAKQGFDAQGVASPFEAGMFLRRYRPHVFVMDLDFEVINGWEIPRIMQLDPEVSNIKKIAVSEREDHADEHTVRASGFNALIMKPFSIDDLVRTVDQVLARTQ
jgi:CheY-like chemotaxis protein